MNAPLVARPIRPLTLSGRRVLQRCAGSTCPSGCCGHADDKRLFRKAVGASPDVVPQIVDGILRSPGQPLDRRSREYFEPRFGHDFSRVRVHTDARAATSARAVNALAFTVGSHIVLDGTSLAEEGDDRRRVLAHELAHAVQQGPDPAVSTGHLSMSQPEDAGEREADVVASAVMRADPPRAPTSLAAHTLRSALPTLARQSPTKLASPGPCTMSCNDPAFLALSPQDRETHLNAQCPLGFPSSGSTFFGRSIPSVSSTVLRLKLLEAQSRARRAMCLAGQDPTGFVIAGGITTYAGHSPAMEKAVDIDVTGQPYVMHETTKGLPETDIDREVRDLYHRVAFWSRYRKSIIPAGITSVSLVPKGSGAQRTWKNSGTGNQEPVDTGDLYDLLREESVGMKSYLSLLLESDKDLTNDIDVFLMFNSEPLSKLSTMGLPIDKSSASVGAFRQRISDDYRILGGGYGQLKAFAGQTVADASTKPATHHGDRPFEGRLPEQGFVTLPKEIVVALTEVGLTWGAIDFGGGSGDVMHFDCRHLPGC